MFSAGTIFKSLISQEIHCWCYLTLLAIIFFTKLFNLYGPILHIFNVPKDLLLVSYAKSDKYRHSLRYDNTLSESLIFQNLPSYLHT